MILAIMRIQPYGLWRLPGTNQDHAHMKTADNIHFFMDIDMQHIFTYQTSL